MSQTTVQARYQVIARIAVGGMGEVFRARDTALGRDVAVKVLHRNLAGDPGFIDRFRQEARSAAGLSHPNIVAVHDWGSTPAGTHFMVMEFVKGRTVRDLLVARGRLEPAHVAEILMQVLAALDHAHGHGIVHRDVKPENILVTEDGRVKVADFGLARAFAESRVSQAPGTVTGTVQYLAPEQIQGEPADPRTDLYALGVVAYELLTGRVPYTGETSLAIAYKHIKERVPPPSAAVRTVPRSMDRVVLSATEKDRDRRPSSAAALRKELVQVVGKLPVAPPLPDMVRTLPGQPAQAEDRAHTVTIPKPPTRRRGPRRILRRLLVALLVMAVLAGGGWLGWQFLAPRYTNVPSVVGLPQTEAEERIEGRGLEVDFGAPLASLDHPPGVVVQVRPEPGSRVREGAEIVLRVSSGLPFRTVPGVEGEPFESAREEVKDAGLTAVAVHEFSDTVPEGLVIEQNPGPAQRVEYGSRVELTVSDGPRPVPIPNIVGSSAGEAEALLVARGFEVKVHEEHSLEVAEGDVIRQRPEGGKGVRGDEVGIWVSLGPRTFPMPNVVGMSTGEAESLLQGEDLEVLFERVPNSTGDTVVGQQPGPDVTVEQGDRVILFIA